MKGLIYGIGGLILFVFAFVFIIAPYQPPTKEDGENYLERNKLKRRVKTLPSGLRYKVLSRFSYVDDSFLRKPLPSSNLPGCKYEGRLVDGVVFDKNSSQPVAFPLVICNFICTVFLVNCARISINKPSLYIQDSRRNTFVLSLL